MYFDNAATSFPKPEVVYERINQAMRDFGANPGRSGHRLSLRMDREIFQARETITRLIGGTKSQRLAFTANGTEALNKAIKGSLDHKVHVITTAMEHNSVLRPLNTLKDQGRIDLTIVGADAQGRVDPQAIQAAIRPDTGLCVTTAMSNLTGTRLDIRAIGQILRERGIRYIVDGAQAVGYLPLNMADLPVDILCFPGHKGAYGPMGTGALYLQEGVDLETLIEGGTGSQSTDPHQPRTYPDRLEAGTENGPGIIGFGAGAQFILDQGLDRVKAHKDRLKNTFIEALVDQEGIELYGPLDEDQGPVVALNIEGMDSSVLAYVLDQDYDIQTRAGAHCAPLAHQAIGTADRGAVRFSFSIFNTVEEVQAAAQALIKIKGGN